MTPFDPERHHRRSIRLKGYDYSQAGAYFVTICTQGRICLFGDVVNDQMELNDAGRLMESAWLDLPNRFPAIELDEFVVMPNHMHGIIVITDHLVHNVEGSRVPTQCETITCETTTRVARTATDNVGAGLVPAHGEAIHRVTTRVTPTAADNIASNVIGPTIQVTWSGGWNRDASTFYSGASNLSTMPADATSGNWACIGSTAPVYPANAALWYSSNTGPGFYTVKSQRNTVPVSYPTSYQLFRTSLILNPSFETAASRSWWPWIFPTDAGIAIPYSVSSGTLCSLTDKGVGDCPGGPSLVNNRPGNAGPTVLRIEGRAEGGNFLHLGSPPLVNGQRYVFSAYVATDLKNSCCTKCGQKGEDWWMSSYVKDENNESCRTVPTFVTACSSNATIGAHLQVRSGNDGGKTLLAQSSGASWTARNGWERLGVSFVFSGATGQTVSLRLVTMTCGGYNYWDAVQFEQSGSSSPSTYCDAANSLRPTPASSNPCYRSGTYSSSSGVVGVPVNSDVADLNSAILSKAKNLLHKA